MGGGSFDMHLLTKDANTVLLTTFKDNLYDEVDPTRYWKLYDGAARIRRILLPN